MRFKRGYHKKVRYKKNFVKIHIELPVKEQTCPHCKAKTTKIKDYRTQIIKDIPIRFKTTLLSYRKRRYQSKECGKTFYEKAHFLPKRARKTTRVTELMLKIIQMTDTEKAIERLNTWVKRNLESDIPSLRSCAKTYFNWITEIRNALKVPYSNEPMEGFNNKIKTLKRVAFGFRNFTNFKARILLMAN